MTMKNPFDDNPLHHNNLSDIFGNHPDDADMNPHDSFQRHEIGDQIFDPLQNNGHLHDLHHDPLHSEWGANHPEHPNVPDPSEWNAGHHEPHGHSEHHAHPHHLETPNLSRSDWTDSANAHSSFGDSEHPLQTDWTSPLPDAVHPPHSHDPNWTPQYDHHTFGSAANSSVLHFESSSDSNKHSYITVSDSLTGHVYLNGDKEIGRIDGHKIYNSKDWDCGYWKTDGKVYDYHDNLVGWVHPDGHVYAKGSNGDVEVYETGKGVAGGAAYLLLVWCGGQTHA